MDFSLKELFERLTSYFKADHVLDIGVSFQDCPKVILENAKEIDRITINKDLLKIGKERYSYPHVNYSLMAAENLSYPDNYFDTIFTSSYHEFDPAIQKKALEEMYRTLKKGGKIIFIEPRESSVTNELFKVFDPSEDHAKRIRNSFESLHNFIKSKNLQIELEGNTEIKQEFKTKREFEETMMEWWSDIKIPKDNQEKQKMIQEIDIILDKANMLNKLEISEASQFLVLRK